MALKVSKGRTHLLLSIINISGFINTVSEESKRQNDLFVTEQKRQKELVGRVEKIEVSYEGTPENATLVMNKNLSTPYDCAKR